MERTRRVRMLITRAKDLMEAGGNQPDTLGLLLEAIDLLRKIENDMARFRNVLGRTGEDLYRERLRLASKRRG